MRYTFLLLSAAILAVPSTGQAHFPFLHWTTLKDDPVLQIYFAESPEPGDPKYLDNLVDGKAWLKTAGGKVEPISIKREEEFLLGRPTVKEPAVFGYQKTWGTLSRGDETFELVYYSKAYSDRAAWKIDTSKHLALDLRPEYKKGTLTVTALWKGKPLANAEIVVQGGVEHFEGKTDAQGQFTRELSDPTVYGIRVRHVEEANAQDESTRRHYATATIHLQNTN